MDLIKKKNNIVNILFFFNTLNGLSIFYINKKYVKINEESF